MKPKIFTAIATLFLFIGTISAQVPVYYIAPEGTGNGVPQLGDESVWTNAAPSINSILDTIGGDLIFYMKAGTYGPIKVWGRDTMPYQITSLKIYGGFSGDELIPIPLSRDLDNPENRTIIEGINDGGYSPALWLETDFVGTTVIDGLTLRSGGNQESLALRLIYTVNTIINRCRFEGSDGSGNLIFVEGIPDGSSHLAIINSVISNNNCTRIAECGYGVKFINTTIADNQCSELMNLYLFNYQDTYELKNSIVKNTSTSISGYWQLDAYNSIVDDFLSIHDTGIDNHSGINFDFTSDNPDDPYACVPNQYITAGGNLNYLMPYMAILNDAYDIIGNLRTNNGTNIDIGAYQGSQIVPSPQNAPMRMDMKDSENINIPTSLKIYPTQISSGGTVYFEKGFESELTARVYSNLGMEVYSGALVSSVEELSISYPAGVYIITVTDNVTGERVAQEKIVVR